MFAWVRRCFIVACQRQWSGNSIAQYINSGTRGLAILGRGLDTRLGDVDVNGKRQAPARHSSAMWHGRYDRGKLVVNRE